MCSKEKERDILSEQIKQHHKTLRQKYMETRDAESVWRENCEDVKALREYAAAMRLLAERHWEHSFNVNPLYSRISWCVQACNQYFRGGDLQKAVDKDTRREHFLMHGSPVDEEEGGTPTKRLSVDVEDDLLVLDVGSCYDPFGNVPGWTVVALDIAPAVSSVFKADFLSLPIKSIDHFPEFRNFISSCTKNFLETRSFEASIDSTQKISLQEIGSTIKVSESSINESSQQPIKAYSPIDKNVKVIAEERMTDNSTVCLSQREQESVENEGKCVIEAEKPLVEVESLLKNTDSSVSDGDFLKGLQVNKYLGDDEGSTNEADITYAEGKTPAKNRDNFLTETTTFEVSELQKSSHNDEISNRPLKWLPKNSFRIVIFCLVLGYMPCPGMRFRCCKQAYDVLKPNGVLVIITPDSKHVGANAIVMKQWQITLGWVGFIRVRYDKLPHLHCMMFRKAPNAQLAHLEAQRLLLKQLKAHTMPRDYVKPQQLFIHQDSQ